MLPSGNTDMSGVAKYTYNSLAKNAKGIKRTRTAAREYIMRFLNSTKWDTNVSFVELLSTTKAQVCSRRSGPGDSDLVWVGPGWVFSTQIAHSFSGPGSSYSGVSELPLSFL